MYSVNDSNYHARKIWTEAGLPDEFLENLHLGDTPDPSVNSSFRLGTAAQTTIGLSGLAAAYFYQLASGKAQTVSVDPRHAILEFKSESYWLIDDKKPSGKSFDELSGLYQTKDGFVRIHTNFPHHKQGILDLLHCEATRESIQAALLTWDAQEFEDQVAYNGMCATKSRTFEEWDKHPHALAIRTTPPVQLIKVGEAPKRETYSSASHPLDGIRVLDLTRVLAGPIAGRTLAAHGADVLLITSPNLPDLPYLDCDTSRGKRTTQLELNNEVDRTKLKELAKEADVFLQAYRPGGLRDKGFGVAELVQEHPGLVCASLTAYGWDGPWKDRRGFDSLVQNATGFGYAEAEAFQQSLKDPNGNEAPLRPLPCQAIDHASGYLLAFGINAALCKTVTEGGSWEVRVSLAAVGQWIRSLGRIEPHAAFEKSLSLPSGAVPWPDELITHSVNLRQSRPDSNTQDETQLKKMTAVAHAAKLSLTPVVEGEAPLRLDANEAKWLQRESREA
ncbi:CoA-transferase family III [Fomitiporia mediterranea MF3/22]|uniref:CoA-transferase family III n=1 Tax=Fomitiporia mediterranea (strain MF3/22) TaxID=694068 RepID=UPI000440948D|nr:CoA-transferase family III [Fomitiporia mediterranea MF3/22]EJC97965.1 CoA-transferase family III [Fomitiporia mediterranea MF3/22]